MTAPVLRRIAVVTGLVVLAAACTVPPGGGVFGRPRVDVSGARPASFATHGSVNQVWLSGARPGEQLKLIDADDRLIAFAAADERGSLIFRDVRAGSGYRIAGAGTVGTAVAVGNPTDAPDASFYAAIDLAPGYGYLTTRDGTQLAINVTLPGPVENGPYPTVVEYSGYSPADPSSPQPSTLLANALGFATVGVNMRGTGCSGGAFQFFEALQWTDGYDVIETVAAQPWVAHGKVGMVGLSYPGISQLFTAAMQPPHLAAIAPLSVIADTGRGTLRPGGILNDGFALTFAADRNRDAQAAPEGGQAWAGNRIRNGDTTCAANQAVREQAPDVLDMVEDHPNYDALALTLTPEAFVHRIQVPVFLAGAWHDEQTGAYFANMLDDFTGTDRAWFTLSNGSHTDPLGPEVFDRWIQFLKIYVAQEVPVRPALAGVIATVVGNSAFGASFTLPPDRFATATSLAEARAVFEADPRVRVLYESGAGGAPGVPYPRFEAGFDDWPVPGTEARAWYFDAASTLVDTAPATTGTDGYVYDASRAGVTSLPGTDNGLVWQSLPPWNWTAPAPEHAVAYETAPLPEDTVMAGTGSVDLWLRAGAPDVDLQVTISEVRPDGQEVLVQSGWQRASQRALAPQATALRPLHTNTGADVEALTPDAWNEVRVEVFPFAHAFRAGSKVRVVVDTPGGNRPRWTFAVLEEPVGTTVEIGRGASQPSRVVLPVVSGVDVPAGLPPCPSLRGQPCRPYVVL